MHLLPTMKCFSDLLGECFEICNCRAVKVDDLAVQVVDHIDLRRRFCKEKRRASGKRLVVEMMGRNQRQNLFKHILLTAVVADGCFEDWFGEFRHISCVENGAARYCGKPRNGFYISRKFEQYSVIYLSYIRRIYSFNSFLELKYIRYNMPIYTASKIKIS